MPTESDWEKAEVILREWAQRRGFVIEKMHRKTLGEHFPMHAVGIEARDFQGECIRYAIRLTPET